jgi:hypothetical protein
MQFQAHSLSHLTPHQFDHNEVFTPWKMFKHTRETRLSLIKNEQARCLEINADVVYT